MRVPCRFLSPAQTQLLEAHDAPAVDVEPSIHAPLTIPLAMPPMEVPAYVEDAQPPEETERRDAHADLDLDLIPDAGHGEELGFVHDPAPAAPEEVVSDEPQKAHLEPSLGDAVTPPLEEPLQEAPASLQDAQPLETAEAQEAQAHAADGEDVDFTDAGEPYRAVGQPKILATGGLLCSVASPITRPELATAIAPSCFRGQIPVRPRINGYFPFDAEGEQSDDIPPTYLLSNEKYTALRYATLSRSVPKSAIERAKKKALAKAIKESPGKQFGEIDILRIDARAYTELLASAHVTEREDPIFYCHDSGFILISERSQKAAEEVAATLGALLKAPIQPFKFNTNPSLIMGGWLQEGVPPEGFEFGRSALLSGAEKAKAKFDNHDLTSKEVIEHLSAGLYVNELQLIYQGEIILTLTSTGFIKGLGISKNADSEEAAGLSGHLHHAILVSSLAIPAIHAALLAIGGGFNHDAA